MDTNCHDPARVRSAAVPITEIRLIRGRIEGEERPSFVVWIDTSERPDLVGLDYRHAKEQHQTLLAYWMYDEDIFYLMVEHGEPFANDFSLPIPIRRYRKELKCLGKNDLVVLIVSGPAPDLKLNQNFHYILSIPLETHHRMELQAALLEWERRNSRLN